MKKVLAVVFLIITLLFGLGLLFYPDISNWYNSRIQSGLIEEFEEQVAELDYEYIAEHIRRAREYNDSISGLNIQDPFVSGSGAVLPPAHYLETLNIGGLMAHVRIPVINVHLPVFHTTTAEVLDRGVGHIEGTSFPVGGIGTHSVLTGHSGLAHAHMFNDLEDVEYGDLFFITVLNYTLAYEVDQIRTVLPHEIELVRIFENEDFVTLITCTPYAVNTHRLLVRGRRVDYVEGMEDEIIVRETGNIDWRFIIIGIIVILFIIFIIIYKRRERKKEKHRREFRAQYRSEE